MIRKVELVDLCEKIFSGGTPDKTKPEYWDGTIPWLNSGETRNDFILETENKITELGVKFNVWLSELYFVVELSNEKYTWESLSPSLTLSLLPLIEI